MALVVFAAAGVVFLQDELPPIKDEAFEPQAGAGDAQRLATSTTIHSPIDITESFVQAQRRAKKWHPSAVLVSVEAIVKDGAILREVVFEFGEAIGQPAPDAPVNAKRLILKGNADRLVSQETERESLRRALPDPNCPMHVALRKLAESGVDTKGTMGVLLAKSDKHNRLVWLFTLPMSSTHPIDAESCALLRR